MRIFLIIFLSLIVGILLGAYGVSLIKFRKVDALLGLDASDPEKDLYTFMVLCPLEDLKRKKYLIVEVTADKNSRF